jgi:hypothetical protein
MARSKEWLKPHTRRHWSDDEKTWTFPSGATLTFGYLEHETTSTATRGRVPVHRFDELTQFNEAQYGTCSRVCAATEDMPVPLRMRAASNPGGVGHAWVKDRFPIGGTDRPEREGRPDLRAREGQGQPRP